MKSHNLSEPSAILEKLQVSSAEQHTSFLSEIRGLQSQIEKLNAELEKRDELDLKFRPEWRLSKPQCFPAEAFASRGSRDRREEHVAAEAVQLSQRRLDGAPVGDGRFEPVVLLLG